jgi:hypothetical protein
MTRDGWRRPPLTRRQWLQATGAAGLLFPFLRPRPAKALALPPRLVLLMQTNGTNVPAFWPSGTGPAPLSSTILDPIALDPLLAPKATLLRNINNTSGGSGNGHDQGFIGLYSGYKSIGHFNDPWGPGISIDQTLKKTLALPEPFPTLNCGVLASDSPPFKAHRRSFSYTGFKQQVPTEIDPYKLYARFFAVGPGAGGGGDPVTVAKRRLQQRKTVLDYVTGDLKALRDKVGSFDRERLDHHETALREMERRLSLTLLPDAARPPRCIGARPPAEGIDVYLEDNAPELIKLMFDFLALALACQLTRIVTFQFGHGGEKWYFRWLGINENTHDDIAHRDDGKNPDAAAKMVKMNVWYAQQVAYLARALARIPEGEGSLLDASLVVWGNEMATGWHGMEGIPVMFLGSGGGRLKRTGVVVDAGPQDYHRLGTTLLNVMGVPAVGFGEAPDCGPLAGLEV